MNPVSRNIWLGKFCGTLLAAALVAAPAAQAQGAKAPASSAAKPVAIAGFAPTMTFNAGVSSYIKLVLKGNGQSLALLLCQDGTGSRTIIWPGNVRLAGGGITLTKTPNKCDAVSLFFDGFNWYETSRAMNLSQ
jgi:hypothetical protein